MQLSSNQKMWLWAIALILALALSVFLIRKCIILLPLSLLALCGYAIYLKVKYWKVYDEKRPLPKIIFVIVAIAMVGMFNMFSVYEIQIWIGERFIPNFQTELVLEGFESEDSYSEEWVEEAILPDTPLGNILTHLSSEIFVFGLAVIIFAYKSFDFTRKKVH